MGNLTSEQLTQAREWINDCSWPDLDDSSELSDAEVAAGVAKHYEGGIASFIRDCVTV